MAQLEKFQSCLKLKAHSEWLSRYTETGLNYPITLEVDPTNECPLDCVSCIWKGFRKENSLALDYSTLDKIVREVAELGVRSLIWTGGGEPLSNESTLEAIKLASSLGLKNAMFTNAVALTPKVTETLLEHLSWIRFHLDAATAEGYTQLHRVEPRVFEKVIKNIIYFTKRRREKSSATSAGVGTIAYGDNLEEIPDLARLCKKMGLDYFQYKHDLTEIRDPAYLNWWTLSVVPIMNSLSNELSEGDFSLQYSQGVDYHAKDESSLCHMHLLATAITASGDVAFCKSLRHEGRWVLGNVKTKSLKEIFDGNCHRELRTVVIPSTCGILPCPYKEANETIEKLVKGRNILLGTDRRLIEHEDFI